MAVSKNSVRFDPARRYFVYRAFDTQQRALYVGFTRDIEGRWRAHRSQKVWSQHAASFKITGPFSERTARELERAEIRRLVPYFNRVQNPGLRAIFERRCVERVQEWRTACEEARSRGEKTPPYPHSYSFDEFWCDRHYGGRFF